MNRIEQIIDDIEEFIESCKNQPLSSNKIIVPKDELYELLTELRLKTPDEIKRYQKIINQKDAILAEARTQADQMIEQAEEHTSNLISEHEIMQQAYHQANEIVRQAAEEARELLSNATDDANNIRMSALAYTEELLANVENAISHSLESTKAKYDTLILSLSDNLNIISNNRKEIKEQLLGTQNQEADSLDKVDEDFDYDFEEDAFTKDIK